MDGVPLGQSPPQFVDVGASDLERQFDAVAGEWEWSTPAGGGYRAPFAALTDKAYAALLVAVP